MVEKGLERESDDVIVGVKAEGLKRFIVRIAMFKIIHELEIRWTGKVGEYYGAAEPPVRCGESHLSGLTEPPHFVY